jgi:hypothetical protein
MKTKEIFGLMSAQSLAVALYIVVNAFIDNMPINWVSLTIYSLSCLGFFVVWLYLDIKETNAKKDAARAIEKMFTHLMEERNRNEN